MKRIVLKLGGSHLTNKDWPQRLIKLLDGMGSNELVLIVGGGEAIEAMRELDQIHKLDETEMHWRCVWMLKATTDIAFELLQRERSSWNLRRVADQDEFSLLFDTRSGRTLHVVDSIAFYNRLQSGVVGESLAPTTGWVTTTDAIAIYCASLLNADECILLKSCAIPLELTIEQAARQGIVDEECPRLTRQFQNVRLQQL